MQLYNINERPQSGHSFYRPCPLYNIELLPPLQHICAPFLILDHKNRSTSSTYLTSKCQMYRHNLSIKHIFLHSISLRLWNLVSAFDYRVTTRDKRIMVNIFVCDVVSPLYCGLDYSHENMFLFSATRRENV